MQVRARIPLLAAVLSFCAVIFAQSPLERAVTLTREKRYSEARQALQGIPEPVPVTQRIAFHRLMAAIASGLNEAQDAATEIRKALQLAPQDSSLLMATAVAEIGAGQLNAALADYTDAMRTAPSTEEYRTTFGFELIRHQAFRPAIKVLSEATPLFPGSAPLRTLLGIAQYAAGDVEDATATLSEAISREAAAEPAYRSLSRIVLQSSAAPEKRVIDQLCSWNRIVCSALQLRVARERDDAVLWRESVAALEQATRDDPIVPCELARAREWANRNAEARTEMEKCVAANPSAQNHFRLGLLYQRLGLSELARKQMDLRSRSLSGMSEQTANGLSALESLH